MTPEELKQRRRGLGLTQARLAAALAVHQPNLAAWESGAVRITHMRAAWLERELGRLEAGRSAEAVQAGA